MEIVHKTLFAWLVRSRLCIFYIAYLRPAQLQNRTQNREPLNDSVSREISDNSSDEHFVDGSSKRMWIGFAGNKSHRVIRIPQFRRAPRKLRDIFKSFHFSTVPLPSSEKINHYLEFRDLPPYEQGAARPVFYYNARAESNPRLYYVPWSSRKRNGYAEHLRRTSNSRITYVIRRLENVETTLRFSILESRLVSALFYAVSYCYRKLNGRKKIVLFYEKFASKAEEGTFTLFESLRETVPDSYFIIDSQSKDFSKIRSSPHVVSKYSIKYYVLLYFASAFVGTEVPTHLSVLRSNNHWLRKSIYIKPYVFLQHGIIFLKNLGITSVFHKGAEGEPAYIIASSQKERRIITRDLLLDPNQVLVTGLAQFSLIKHNYINQSSDDVVSVMLTWRIHDEPVSQFEDTSYFQYVMQAVSALRTVSPSIKIRVIPHPKVLQRLSNDSELHALIWTGNISDALQDTKLLITDYSSIVYNAFYRGAAAVFFQPDLELYEGTTGPLVPLPHEYVGYRTFTAEELSATLAKGISEDGIIDLKKLRTSAQEMQYSLINEFDDGKNIDRIKSQLKQIIQDL